jgi:hypothetical protein
MMSVSFDLRELSLVGEALDVAEDTMGNYYKYSFAQWKRHRYDVKTLRSLGEDQMSEHAFALLNKGVRRVTNPGFPTNMPDYFVICLQDHRILKALKRDAELELLPLLVYVFTHELIHIVRFCNFKQRFDVSERQREREEATVHSLTYDILGRLSLPKLDYLLDSYRDHSIFEIVSS